jgi:hypothetical protein
MSNEPKSGRPGGHAPGGGDVQQRPWINGDTVDAYAVLVDFGNSLNVAGDRVIGAAERYRRAGSQSERDQIRTELAGFLRRAIGAQCIAFSVLGGELPLSVIKEDP